MNLLLRRILAAWLDHSITVILVLLAQYVLFGVYPSVNSVLISFTIGYSYLIFRDILGKSIGKVVFRLKITYDSKMPQFFCRILRNITILIIPLEVVFVITENKRIGDMLAKTNVVMMKSKDERTNM